jgi:hypothetical protein
MPVICKPIQTLLVPDLFDGRLQRYGVYELLDAKSAATSRSLFDGRNKVRIEGGAGSQVTQIAIWGSNIASNIFEAIREACGVKIVTEHDPEYWGFKTDQEWRTALSVERHQHFIVEFQKYFNGQSNQIKAEFANFSAVMDEPLPSMSILKAIIARSILIQDSRLTSPENKLERLRTMLAELVDLGVAIHFDFEEDITFDEIDGDRFARQIMRENEVESACRYIYQIDQRGVIVAVSRPEPNSLTLIAGAT